MFQKDTFKKNTICKIIFIENSTIFRQYYLDMIHSALSFFIDCKLIKKKIMINYTVQHD